MAVEPFHADQHHDRNDPFLPPLCERMEHVRRSEITDIYEAALEKKEEVYGHAERTNISQERMKQRKSAIHYLRRRAAPSVN